MAGLLYIPAFLLYKYNDNILSYERDTCRQEW